ncbi:MAG: hypothetical protein RLZZ142_651 [Verrucomicrobiota bacterium]
MDRPMGATGTLSSRLTLRLLPNARRRERLEGRGAQGREVGGSLFGSVEKLTLEILARRTASKGPLSF